MIRPNVSHRNFRTAPPPTGDRADEAHAGEHGLIDDAAAAIPRPAHPRPSFPTDVLDPASGPDTVASSKRVTRLKLFWRVTCALCVGIVVVISGGFEYHARARFRVSGSVHQARVALLEFLWQHWKQPGISSRFSVDLPTGGDALDLHFNAPDAGRADLAVRTLAAEFTNHATRLSRQTDEREGDIRELVDRLLAKFQSDSDGARVAAENAEAQVPAHVPFDLLESLHRRLDIRIQILDALRTSEDNLQTQLRRLDVAPLPLAALIDPETRQAAYTDRTDLQQDLAQLVTQLTLGRRSLEDVWQNASPQLDDLIAAAGRLSRVGLSTRARDTARAQRTRLDDLHERAGHYQRRLATFAEKWTQTFTVLRRQQVDPKAPRLMNIQSRLHDLLGDFSFHSAKLIDDMRNPVRMLAEQTDAAHHLLLSEVKRLFHRLESQHRQFEFVASDVFRRNNFRLDSAMKSATGLYRRVQRATQQIDAELEANALARARTEKLAANTAALAERERIRPDIDAAMDQIVELLAEYAAAVPLAEQYLRPSLTAEAARQRLADAEQRLARCRSFVGTFQERRPVDREPISIELISCSVERTPGSVAWRVLWGVLAAGLTLTAAGYIGRRWSTVPWA